MGLFLFPRLLLPPRVDGSGIPRDGPCLRVRAASSAFRPSFAFSLGHGFMRKSVGPKGKGALPHHTSHKRASLALGRRMPHSTADDDQSRTSRVVGQKRLAHTAPVDDNMARYWM